MSTYDNDRPLTSDERNPYASSSRWRHQESSAFAQHAAARSPIQHGSTGDLASFLNKSRIEPDSDANSVHSNGEKYKPIAVAASGLKPPGANLDGSANSSQAEFEAPEGKGIVCGPLLNYRRMEEGRWYGSVLVVIQGGGGTPQHQPFLIIRRASSSKQPDNSPPDETNGVGSSNGTAEESRVEAHCLYSDPRNTFWAFDIDVPIGATETSFEYEIPDMIYSTEHKPRLNTFFVPAASESMRMMFHSCNGFSVGTDEDAWSGPALWNDVIRKHKAIPFHVMIGGGDQIYNDSIRVSGPLRPWTDIKNPRKRREYPFSETLRAECDDFYLKNYLRWYNTPPFSMANGQIPQINIWDDHDIIDGFGSYIDHFMRCDVFRGIGGLAHKYYMLFQHHMPPPLYTYTTDYAALAENTQGPDPNQLVNTYVAPQKPGSQYIVGTKPGPYVAERSYNLYARLGARVALLGIDARTERTRHQVNYPETYEVIFNRLRYELQAAVDSNQPIKHLILLLGIPIAYPRLTWLENIFRSPLMGPVKLLNRRFGLGGGLFNQFDGSIDLLDDLDDHYTARTHKKERAELMVMLQDVAAEFSVRVTILGGDVHLAALGRFYSKPDLKVPVEEDHRYMVNVVSSAIVNKPPPQAVANLLARRNKIHHMNHKTDETMLDLFNKDPGGSTKTANHNHCTMPSRNFACITENSPNNAGGYTNGHATGPDQDEGEGESGGVVESFLGNDGHSVLHKGEVGSGTDHKAALRETHGTGYDGTLDVCINVEIDQHDPDGRTDGYGLTVPLLDYVKRVEPETPPSTASQQ
ncbi:hypothetical protein QQX98_002403 [Neonectria punicea]|uniref:PhoD-like phosphatase domain-containing protein n=1 Tax=Neonectria punicea TaxID=979145 RepID=A0ABR1HIN5_9HYPO